MISSLINGHALPLPALLVSGHQAGQCFGIVTRYGGVGSGSGLGIDVE
jgi:hypothetical protein